MKLSIEKETHPQEPSRSRRQWGLLRRGGSASSLRFGVATTPPGNPGTKESEARFGRSLTTALGCLTSAWLFTTPSLQADALLNTNALWVADRGQLEKISPAGALFFAIPTRPDVGSMAADPVTGAIWAADKKRLTKYAFDGSPLFQLSLGSTQDAEDARRILLAMDSKQGRPWVAFGQILLALEPDGGERFRRGLAEEATAIAYNAATREIWVATEREISIFDDNGGLVGSVVPRDLDEPRLAPDPHDGSTWLAFEKHLLKFDSRHQEVLRVRLQRETGDLAVDPQTGDVWVIQGPSVVKRAATGHVLFKVQPFGRGEEGEEEDAEPSLLALDPSNGGLWVASRRSVALVSSMGAVFHVRFSFAHIRALAIFADLIPPKLEILYPAADAFINVNAPTFKLRYSDNASGVDTASLKVEVDGRDVTSTCHIVDGGSDCALSGTLVLPDGLHTLHARVADRMGNTTELSQSFTVKTIPPPAPDATRIDIEGTGDPNTWQVTGGPGAAEPFSTVTVRNSRTGASVSVPAGADGSFTLTIAGEQGDVLLIIATDRAGNVSRVTEKRVASLPPQAQGSGFIHGLVLQTGSLRPVAGVHVSVRGISGAVFTDPTGRFTFPAPGTGFFTLFLNRRGFITVRRDQYVVSQRHATVTEVHLTAFDTMTGLISAATGGSFTDSTGKVQAIFPPGAVANDMAISGTYFANEADFPLPMPEGVVFIGAAQMTPEHRSFLRPVTLRIRNDRGFAPGTPIPFAFASHDEEDSHDGFYDPGMGTVTQDGSFIEVQVNHFSCGVFGLAPPPTKNPGDDCPACDDTADKRDPCDEAAASGTSSVCFSNGNVEVEQHLASVGAMGGREALAFAYTSSTAHPKPLISVNTKLSSLYFPTAPALSQFKVSIEGVDREFSFQGTIDKTVANYLWDGVNAGGLRGGTGAYAFKVTSTGIYSGTLYTATNFGGVPTNPTNIQSPQLPFKVSTGGYVMFNDQAKSPFGAGWGLTELERLYPQPEGTVLWTDGAGGSMVIRPGTGPVVFKSGFTQAGGLAIDRAANLYVGEYNGRITKIAPDGSSSVFAVVGGTLSSLTFDRAGNLYALQYEGNFSGSPVIVKIDPSGRSTVVLQKITFPSFTPGNLGDMVVDAQGNIWVVNTQHPILAKVTPSGQATIVPGYEFNLANQSSRQLLTFPSGMAIDPQGNLYISNNYNDPTLSPPRCGRSFISKISPQGAHSYYAVGLDAPRGMTFDDLGNLYVADRSCATFAVDIKLISPTGVVTTVDRGYPPPVTGASRPFGYSYDLVAGSGGALYMVTDSGAVYRTFLHAPPRPGEAVTYAGPFGDYSRLERHPDGTYTRILKDATRIEFNAAGLEIARVELNGDTTSYAYDGSGRLVSRTNAVGQVWKLSYSGEGLASVTDPAGRVTAFTVSGGDLLQVTHPDGSAVSFGYDSRHLLTRKTDARGFTTNYEYDGQGKAAKVALPTREVRQFDIGRIRTAANNLPPGVGTPNNPAPPVRPQDTEDRYVDGRGLGARFVSNRFGSLVRGTRPDGTVYTIDRDRDNNPVKSTESNGATVTMTYDAKGNLTFYDQAGGPVYSAAYDPLHNKPALLGNSLGVTGFVYNSGGSLIRIIDPRNQRTEYTVGAHGLPTQVTLPDGSVVSYSYDSLSRLTAVTDPLLRTTRFVYDAAGNVIQRTDAAGRATKYTYDALNRPTATIDALGQRTAFTYQPACTGCATNPDQLVGITDAKSQMTTFEYDAIGELVKTTDPLGRSKSFTYDLNRNLASVTDSKKQTMTFDYDDNNRQVTTNLPEGRVSYRYDTVGNLISLSDAFSSLTLAYDAANRLVKATPGGLLPPLLLSYGYDRLNNRSSPLRTSLTAPWGSLTYTYDPAGNPESLSGSSAFYAYFYDAVGRRTTAAGFLGRAMSESFAYDLGGQLASRQSSAGALIGWQYGYDLLGNRTSQVLSELYVDALPLIKVSPDGGVTVNQVLIRGNTFEGTVKVNGQPVALDSARSFSTQVAVAPGPNSITIEAVRPSGARTVKTISVTGQPQSVPTISRLYSADQAGNIYATDPSGRVLRIATDASVIGVSGLDPSPDHVFAAADGTVYAWYGAALKRLDPQARVTVRVGQLPFFPEDVVLLPGGVWLVSKSPTLYKFDPATNTVLAWVTLPVSSPNPILLAANGSGNVLAIPSNSGVQFFRIQADGHLTVGSAFVGANTIALDNAGNAYLALVIPEAGFFERLSPTGISTRLLAAPATTPIVSDGPGNVYLISLRGLETVTAGTINSKPFLVNPPTPLNLTIQVLITPPLPSQRRKDFTYDSLDRLATATPGESYSYDPVGSRTTSHLSRTEVVDVANELLEDDAFTYTYDANGNLTQRKSKADDTVFRYSWDSQNRLVRVDLPGTVAEYAYDPLGRRIQKVVNGVVTKYLYDGSAIVAELDGNNNITTTYVHGPRIDEPLTMTRNNHTYAYQRDALGSITHLTDENGVVVQRYEYDSYGNITAMLDPRFVQPYAFTSREWNPETGLYYYRARYYDPKLGRFISEDPIRFLGGINFYVYVGGNPTTRIDPSGKILGVVGAGVAVGLAVGVAAYYIWPDSRYHAWVDAMVTPATEAATHVPLNAPPSQVGSGGAPIVGAGLTALEAEKSALELIKVLQEKDAQRREFCAQNPGETICRDPHWCAKR